MLERPLEIRVVLLLHDPGPFGAAAWRACTDAVALFDVEGGWIEVSEASGSEVRLMPRIEPVYLGPADIPGAGSALPAERVAELLQFVQAVDPLTKSATRRGVSGSTVVDPMALVGYVGDALDASGPCMVVHDRPIQPPPDQRYVIWSPVPGGVAVSFAPLDPLYWGERQDDAVRQDVLRRRLRAVLCAVLGTAIGLVRCDNPTCFLFAGVDNVTQLDALVRIGEEHGVPALSGRGYTSPGEDPLLAADVVQLDAPDLA